MYSANPCRLLSIKASHSAYSSKPDELTEKILTAGGDRAAAGYTAAVSVRTGARRRESALTDPLLAAVE
jgi:hypothetical protein